MIDIDKFKEYCKAKFTKENKRILAAYEQHPQYHGRTDIFDRLRDVNREPLFSDLEEYLVEYVGPEKIISPTGRYLVFYYDSGYGLGGLDDLLIRIDDLENFKETLKLIQYLPDALKKIHCFDLETNETIDLKEEMKNDRNS